MCLDSDVPVFEYSVFDICVFDVCVYFDVSCVFDVLYPHQCVQNVCVSLTIETLSNICMRKSIYQ